MDEKDYLKEVIERPITIGEEIQSKRIRKFSRDIDSIIELRKKLRKLKDELTSNEKELDYQINLYKRRKGTPLFERRYYDKSVLVKKPLSIFKQLFYYRSVKRIFKSKYGKGNKIIWSIWNFIINVVLFYPARPVYKFVQDMIILLDEIREPFRKMYMGGWLDEKGADLLTPEEFNLISEMERLVWDETIFNFLIYYRQPDAAIRKINPFLGYYFSLTRGKRVMLMLRDSVEKSLNIVYADLEYNKKNLTVRKIMKSLNRFLSGTIENEFLIPLFESVFLKTFTGDEMRDYISLEEIGDTEYNANSNLLSLMANKKKKYNELLKKDVVKLEEELALIIDIKETIENQSSVKGALTSDLIAHLLLSFYHNNTKVFETKIKNLALVISDLCNIFLMTYESILNEGVNVRVDREIKTVKIFDPGVFDDEITSIRLESRMIGEFAQKGYQLSLLHESSPGREETIFISSLNNVNDSFYLIGEKLYSALKGHLECSLRDEDYVNKPIGIDDLGSSAIPFSAKAVIAVLTSDIYRYSISNKRVKEALEEIKTFCFSIPFRFEYRHRDFSKGIRKESIAEKIAKLDTISEKIEQLEAGQDIDI